MRSSVVFAATLLCVMLGFSYLLSAQNPQVAPPPAAERIPNMTFFVTSVGKGNGGNLGGLAGADAHCQMLGQAAGAPANRTWHAYLSTQGPGAINARDRIGRGPWTNVDGAEVATNLAQLHGDGGQGSIFNRTVGLTEKGRIIDGSKHDILTGTQEDGKAFTDGMDHTCSSWTSNAAGAGSAQVGHSDRSAQGGGAGGGVGGGGGSTSDRGRPLWNTSHGTPGCSQENIVSSGGGAGLLYCFAIN